MNHFCVSQIKFNPSRIKEGEVGEKIYDGASQMFTKLPRHFLKIGHFKRRVNQKIGNFKILASASGMELKIFTSGTFW